MSYNSLHGLGSHSADAATICDLLMDDNAPSTTLTDRSGNGNDATHWRVTSSSAGPGNAWFTRSMQYDGSTSSFSKLAAASGGLGDLSMSAWVRVTDTARDGAVFGQFSANTSSLKSFLAWSDVDGSGVGFATLSNYGLNYVDGTNNTDNQLNTWKHVSTVCSGGVVDLYVDGVKTATADTGSLRATSTSPVTLGANYGDTDTTYDRNLEGDIGPNILMNRVWTAAEVAEDYAGPEPLNLTAPVLSQGTYTISTTDGTWDSQANGTIIYTRSWEYADDASGTNPVAISVTASEFGPTPAMSGKFVRVTVSASNDGGSDPAEDQVSAWTAITAVPRGLGKEVAHWCPSWKDDSAESVVTDYTLSGYDMNYVNMGASNWIADTSEGGVRALDFNGTNEYCQTDLNNVPYSSLDAQLQTSVSAWVYGELTSSNGNPWAYAKTQGGISSRRVGYRLVDRGGDEVGQCAFASQDGSSSAQIAVKTANGSQPRSTWYHVYAEFEKSATGYNQNASTRLWIDGVYIGEDSDTTNIFDNEPLHRMFLGQNTRTKGNLETTYFDGRLDDIRFFGEHLTQDEVTHLASARGVEGTPASGVVEVNGVDAESITQAERVNLPDIIPVVDAESISDASTATLIMSPLGTVDGESITEAASVEVFLRSVKITNAESISDAETPSLTLYGSVTPVDTQSVSDAARVTVVKRYGIQPIDTESISDAALGTVQHNIGLPIVDAESISDAARVEIGDGLLFVTDTQSRSEAEVLDNSKLLINKPILVTDAESVSDAATVDIFVPKGVAVSDGQSLSEAGSVFIPIPTLVVIDTESVSSAAILQIGVNPLVGYDKGFTMSTGFFDHKGFL